MNPGLVVAPPTIVFEGWASIAARARAVLAAVLSDDPSADLIASAAAGDRAAAQRIARTLLPRVRNLVRYLARGDSSVDDIAQEALVAVIRGLPGYRGEGRFKSWVDRIVARTTFAEIARRRDALEIAADVQAAPDEPAALAVDSYHERRQIAAVLDRLPSAQRHALVLHHVLELSVPEIASMLSTPVDTIKSRLKTGKSEFRRLWVEDEGPAPFEEASGA